MQSVVSAIPERSGTLAGHRIDAAGHREDEARLRGHLGDEPSYYLMERACCSHG